MGAFHAETSQKPVEFSPHARKTSGTQAKSADVGTENKGAYRKSELAGWLVFAKTKYAFFESFR